MMAVLKLISQRENTYAQVMVAVRRAQEMQQKAEKRARKFRKQARLLEQA
jgi:DNA-directed RNA polymerase subunit K/omega